MARWLIAFLVGGVLGAGAGFIGGLFFFPFIFPPPPAAALMARDMHVRRVKCPHRSREMCARLDARSRRSHAVVLHSATKMMFAVVSRFRCVC